MVGAHQKGSECSGTGTQLKHEPGERQSLPNVNESNQKTRAVPTGHPSPNTSAEHRNEEQSQAFS